MEDIKKFIVYFAKEKEKIINSFWMNNNPETETEKKYTYQNVQKMAIHHMNESVKFFLQQKIDESLKLKIPEDDRKKKIAQLTDLINSLYEVKTKL